MSYINNTNFAKSIRYIFDNIDQAITLDDIATHVGMSLSSLKRLFLETTNQAPGIFIRRMRMEFAFRTLQSRKDTILEVALSAGFDDQSAFARCFKETFGYSPSEARKKLNIVNELESVSLNEPDITEIVDFQIQSVTKKGLYFDAAPSAWEELKKKLTLGELQDDFSGIYVGIGHDNPHDQEVAENQVRFTAGISLLDRDVGIDHLKISGGKYARFQYHGKINNLGLAYHYIYGKWLEGSKYKIDNAKPAFIAFDSFPDALKEHTVVIHVPLLSDIAFK